MAFSNEFEQRMAEPSPRVRRFLDLLEPVADRLLERMAAEAAALTRRHFGKTMRLFAPIYLSNECINSCAYCGFSRENVIVRVTLEPQEVLAEARHLIAQGFRSILLVSGEHPRFVSNGYIEECVRLVAAEVPSVAIEVAPMEAEEYRPIVAAGAEGLVVYQETYHRPTYETLHTAGPKKDFLWRLDCPERGHAAGFRRIGIGALFGLYDWRFEARALATHLDYLQRTCWRAFLTVSLPRIRPAAGGFQPPAPLGDRDYIQLLCALRIAFPTVGIVLSTRESPALRDAVAPLGVTLMSAGSHTEPGGYTGQGRNCLHYTVRGKIAARAENATFATRQFEIHDDRPPEVVAERLRKLGLDPVWKDWDSAILGIAHAA